MKKKWEKLMDKVTKADNELSSAVNNVAMNIVYNGFDFDDEPSVDMATSHELIMSWHGSELYPQEFIELMESKRCIEPSDFSI